MQWTARGLDGVRVVDLTAGLDGLFCAHRLHHLGADAVTTTRAAPAAGAWLDGLHVVAGDDPARADAVAAADIVVDDDRPEVLDVLARMPASAVRVVITPFGRTGPNAGFTGTDLTVDTFGGAVSSTGHTDRPPLALGGHLVATYVGAVAAAAACAELVLTERTGVGATVDVAAVEAMAASMDRRALQLLTCSYTGWDAVRSEGRESPLITGVLRCADGLVYVTLYGWHVRVACELIGGLDAFAERPALALRPPGNAAFKAAVRAWVGARTRDEAVGEAQAVGWPIIPANTLRSALDDPWLAAAGLVRAGPDGGRRPATGISITPAPPARGGPRLARAVSERPGRPLDGIRVLDLTVVLSGPSATMVLGDLGADVVRVESRRHYPSATKGPRRVRADGVEGLGNTRRGYADREPGDEPWHRFAVANLNGRGKRSVTLEIESTDGRAAFEALVGRADVLAENNAPGFLERRGYPPHRLFDVNPRLVLVRMPGGATAGPLADVRGLGPAFEAFAGVRDARGYPDLPPERQPDSMYMDATTGPAAVAAVVAALRDRERTGAGSLVVVSQLGVMMDHAADLYAEPRGPAVPRENWSVEMAPHGIYRCAGGDEWLAISCRDDLEWRALAAVIDAPPVAVDATLVDRLAATATLDAWIGAWTAGRDKDVWRRLQRAGITAAPVLREGELLADAHLAARRFFLDLDHPVVGVRRTPGPSWRSDRWTIAPPAAAPLLGEHNDAILGGVLGYDDARLARLREAGEIGTDYPSDV